MIKLITPPASEPVTLAEVTAHPRLRIDSGDDDTVLNNMIAAAREVCEEYTRMSFLPQTWDMVIDSAGKTIDLHRPPLATVTGVYVTDDAGVETTVPSSSYRVDTISVPGRIFLKPLQSWPAYTEQSGFRVRYTAGYANAAAVPQGIKQAIISLVAYIYNNDKGAATFAAQVGSLPDDVKILLAPFKVYL